jgi:hypothetical protein
MLKNYKNKLNHHLIRTLTEQNTCLVGRSKNHGFSRDFLEGGNSQSPTKALEDQVILRISNRLDQRTDAFSTQHFSNLATILENRDRLQVGAEGALRGFLRPGSVATKGRRLPAMFTLCHLRPSFLPQ